MSEFLIELFLHILDGVLDVVTFSRWTRWQGARVPNVKVKK
jgi:hypothetical protein